MKRFCGIMTMFVCIMISVILTEISVYAGYAPSIFMSSIEFSTSKSGTYYDNKEELLNNTPEKTKVTGVYVKITLGVNEWDNTDIKITKVTGIGASNSGTNPDGAVVTMGPLNANTDNTLTIDYSYKDEDKKAQNGSEEFRVASAASFTGEDYGRIGTYPTGKLYFELSGGSATEGDRGTTSSEKKLYRYDQKVDLKADFADNELSEDGKNNNIGVAYVWLNGTDMPSSGVEYKLDKNPVGNDTRTHNACAAGFGPYRMYEDIENFEYSLDIKDGVGKESETYYVNLSDHVLKHRKIDAEIIPDTEFKPYIENDEVVIEFKITYGQEFLEGISTAESTSSDLYVSEKDSERVTIVQQDGSNYNNVYKVKTKKNPKDSSKKVYLHYKTNTGGDGYTPITYTLSDDLAAGYESTYSSNIIQKFDISKGNLLVEEDNIAHYGKVISGDTTNGEEEESTVTCADIIMITGKTDKYNVKIKKGGKKIILGNGLEITSSDCPIELKGGTEKDSKDNVIPTSIVMEGSGTIKTTGANKSAIHITGGITDFYKKDKSAKFEIESTQGAGISVGDEGDINIYQVDNLKITAGNGGAGIGTEGYSKGGKIHIKNSVLEIAVTGEGAAIGTGEQGILREVKVEGTMGGGNEGFGSNKIMKLTVENGACIGAGNRGTIGITDNSGRTTEPGIVYVENVAGIFTVGQSGVAIGVSYGGECGDITVNRLRIEVKKNNISNSDDYIGAGIGASKSGKCGNISIEYGVIDIEKCTVGVGADTNAECGNITIKEKSELKVSNGKVGIGARSGGKMGNIEITSTQSDVSQVDLTTTEVGIGSESSETGESNIEIISAFWSNGVPETRTEVIINCPNVCIGAANGGRIGNIQMNDCNKITLTSGTNGVGIGAGSNSEVKDITLDRSNTSVDNCKVGLGGMGKIGNIRIKKTGKVVLKSSEVGMGSCGEVGDIEITWSTVQIGTSNSKSKVGMGVSETATKMGSITIREQSRVRIYAEDIGMGSKSNNTVSSTINIVKDGENNHPGGVKLEITGIGNAGVGIGATGKIGNIKLDSNGDCSTRDRWTNITIAGTGIGIGASGTCGTITVAGNIKIGDSSNKCKVGIGSTGTCGNIEIIEGNSLVNKVVICASDVGIGLSGASAGTSSGTTPATITVRNVKLDISGCGVGIGVTDGAKVGNIYIIKKEGLILGEWVKYCGLKINPNTSGIGIGGNGTCGDIECTGMPMQLGGTNTKCSVGIGTLNKTTGNIKIDSCNGVKIYAGSVGIGSGSENTSEKDINISNSKVDIEGAALGIGGSTTGKLHNISTKGSDILIKTAQYGLGIGAYGGSATVGDICIEGTNIGIENCAIGIGASGTCGAIKIKGCENAVIKSNTVGIGGTKKTGAIILEKSTFEIADSTTKSAVGIGAHAEEVGDMLIGSCKMKIYASDVGIGSKSAKTGKKENGKIMGRIIYITNSKIDISGTTAGIGANEGNIGMIMIGNMGKKGATEEEFQDAIEPGSTEMTIVGSGTLSSVGVGLNGGYCSRIHLQSVKANISGVSMGIGTNNEVESFLIGVEDPTALLNNNDDDETGDEETGDEETGDEETGDEETGDEETGDEETGDEETEDEEIEDLVDIIGNKIVISASGVGIGVTSDNKDISLRINYSIIEARISWAAKGVGIGTTKNGKLKDITFIKSRIKVIAGENKEGKGIGVGGFGEVPSIVLRDDTKTDIGGGIVAIGVSGENGKCDKISITECLSVSAYGSEVCIGSDSSLSENEVCEISINASKVNVAGDGVGIGGTTNVTSTIIIGGIFVEYENGELEEEGGSIVGVKTGSTGIGGSGKCGNISISQSDIAVESNGGGAGIGALDTVGAITIGSSTLNVSTVEIGTCIGGDSIKGDISIKNSNIETNSVDGIGIGGNKVVVGGVLEENGNRNSKISVERSEISIKNTGEGSGIGINDQTSTLNSIDIKNSVIKINGGSGNGVGIGAKAGAVGVDGKPAIDLKNNIISIFKGSGSTGAGIGSGESGDIGDIVLEKNKIVVATGDGAGIGSGASGNVTGTITIKDGVIIGKSRNGACIGAGENGYVQYLAIEDGKINARATGDGACIGAGSGSVGTLRIDKGKIVCNAGSTARGISAWTLDIGNSEKVMDNSDINIAISSQNGNAIDGGNITINYGYIEAVSSGANGIYGYSSVEIAKGVVKAKGNSSEKDIKGGSIEISRNANVQAYNNRTSSVVRGNRSVTQRKISTDFLRNYDGIVKWSNGGSSGYINTDSSGCIYFWYNDSIDKNMIFNMDGKVMVIKS